MRRTCRSVGRGDRGRCVGPSRGARIDCDFLILAPGVRHADFGRSEWEAHAPGLKTLDDAIADRRRILLAFERAEREPSAVRRRDLLTFVIVGGGPTGIELAGTLAEIVRQTLRDQFRSIDTAKARVVVFEAGPSILPAVRESLRRAQSSSPISRFRRHPVVADLGWIRLSGVLGWLAWLLLHIATLIGFRSRIVVGVEWAVAYLTFQRSAQLITGDDPDGR
jgi:NADH dehydrogenase FAD-containing subunit